MLRRFALHWQSRALVGQFAYAKHLRLERRADSVQQISERPVARPFVGRATGGAHPSEVGEIRLNREHPARTVCEAGVAAGVKTLTGLDARLPFVGWSAPSSDGGSPVTQWKVQWKSGTQAYGTTRQELLPATTIAAIYADERALLPGEPVPDYSVETARLAADTECTFRVVAVNAHCRISRK